MRQQIPRQQQAAVQKFEPLAVPPAVVCTDVAVVVNPVLVAGVVGRVELNHADFAGVGAFEQPQGIKVVALDDQIGRARNSQRRQPVRIGRHQARQHDVGIERPIALQGAAFPIQPEFLPR